MEEIVSSESNLVSHASFDVNLRIDLYLASDEDNEIVTCFLDFQEMGPPSKVMKYPLIDLLDWGKEAQSELQYASKEKEEFFVGKQSLRGLSGNIFESIYGYFKIFSLRCLHKLA